MNKQAFEEVHAAMSEEKKVKGRRTKESH